MWKPPYVLCCHRCYQEKTKHDTRKNKLSFLKRKKSGVDSQLIGRDEGEGDNSW